MHQLGRFCHVSIRVEGGKGCKNTCDGWCTCVGELKRKETKASLDKIKVRRGDSKWISRQTCVGRLPTIYKKL